MNKSLARVVASNLLIGGGLMLGLLAVSPTMLVVGVVAVFIGVVLAV